jgi:hypothetical protein
MVAFAVPAFDLRDQHVPHPRISAYLTSGGIVPGVASDG